MALGSWNGPHTTIDESCCGDAAPKLAALLRGKGIPVRLVEAEFHYYVILYLPEGQMVVDPTVRQFFGKKGAPRSVPAVFVGTIGVPASSRLSSIIVRGKLLPDSETRAARTMAELAENFKTPEATVLARARAALEDLDKAPIGTIHSFCSQILRLYPRDRAIRMAAIMGL